MRNMHTDRKKPTPIPTVTKSTTFGMWGTVSAKTCRSGSATVTAKPRTKLTSRISGRFRVLVSAVPILLPMGVMEISAPRENSPMPRIRNSVPKRKLSTRSVGSGDTVSDSRRTMITMGNTLFADSRIFSAISTALRRKRLISIFCPSDLP